MIDDRAKTLPERPFAFLLLGLALVLSPAVLSCAPEPNRSDTGPSLTGTAEDLWGTPVDLGRQRGLTIIEPFSPANCGYCMIDGEFIKANYFAPNAAAGGRNFYQCLFNPQRDVLAYLKHMRSERVPVLTFPPALHRYHRNGFPFLIAFRDRQPIYQSYTQPYEEKVRELTVLFWPDRSPEIVLTSPSHMAGRFIFENESAIAVYVVPDSDAEGLRRWQERKAQWRGNPGDPKQEGDLTPEDLGKNLLFSGPIDRFRFDALQDPAAPLRIDGASVVIGPHSFPRNEVGLRAAFPNPHNPERYVLLALQAPGGADLPPNNWADYAVYAAVPRSAAGAAPRSAAGDPPTQPAGSGLTESGAAAPLLEGLFAKHPGNRWAYADSLCFGVAAGGGRCEGSHCPAPVTWNPDAARGDSAPPKSAIRAESTSRGPLWTLGAATARFPALAPGPGGTCWVAWEERGDIFTARFGRAGSDTGDPAGGSIGGSAEAVAEHPTVHAVESDPSDSYDPVLAATGDAVWVFYLNDRDGFYRLRGRCLRAGRWSAELPISDTGPVDVITPAAAAGPDGRIVVAWSQWKANQRFLQYRTIAGDVLGPVCTAAIAPSELEDYVNAWFPSLAFASAGELWGAWNQHYPASLSVCSGNLASPGTAVTRVAPDHNACENGGYPAAVVDGAGDRWVIWESFGWDVLSGNAQAILASRFDEGSGAWGLSQVLTVGEQTYFNQTPCAVLDPDGALLVAWSGRDRDGRQPWSIYLSRRADEAWSAPERISPEGVCARAPRICSSGAEVWVAWHEGVGDAMRAQVLRVGPGSQ
jgi:hypothetical protein